MKLFEQIKQDLEGGEKLQLSFLGKIATVKMNILPKVIFLFQNLPIKLEQKFFEELNALVVKFIWQKKKPRIKRKLLKDAKERRGFGLPNWNLYYQAGTLT